MPFGLHRASPPEEQRTGVNAPAVKRRSASVVRHGSAVVIARGRSADPGDDATSGEQPSRVPMQRYWQPPADLGPADGDRAQLTAALRGTSSPID